MCGFLQKYPNTPKLMLTPRGSFKSTIGTMSYAIWNLLRNPNKRILIATAELSNARKFMAAIQTHLEQNEVFRDLYGHWDSEKNRLPWSSENITVSARTDRRKVEASITCISYKVSKVSQHYDMAILDDLQTEKNVTSPEMIDDIEDFIKMLTPILDPDPDTGQPGPTITIGTRWHLDDIYGRRLSVIDRQKVADKNTPQRHAPRTRVLVRKAIDSKGNLYFPKRITAPFLRNIVDSEHMTRYQFSCQYQNDPMPEEDRVFKIRDMRFWNTKGRQPADLWPSNAKEKPLVPISPYLNHFITVDPSVGEYADSDYTGMVVGGVDPEFNIILKRVVREHLNPEEIIELLFTLVEQYKPRQVGIEGVAFQKALLYAFNRFARERGKWFNVIQLQPEHHVRKDLRIRGFSPFLAKHQLYFQVAEDLSLTEPQEVLFHSVVEGQRELATEMAHFPLAKTKDCVDALSYFPSLIYPAGVPAKALPGEGTADWLRRRMLDNRRRNKGRLGRMLERGHV